MADVEQQPGVESSSSNESTVEKQLTVKSEANADRKPLSDLAPWAETLSKAVAGIVVAVYACGFLIVSIYHSQYGFVGTNPFRPRVLAAGAWFFLFAGIPISIAASFRNDSWKKIARNSAGLWIACFSLSILLGNLLFDYTTPSTVPGMRWWWIVIFIVVWALLVFLTSSYPKFPEWIAITGSVLLSLLYVADPLRRFFKHEFNTASLALWFFVTFIVVLFEFKIRNRENLISYGGWSKPLAVLFAALLVFSQYVYPHLKASWGGGTPANVTIYFTKDSMISPDGNAQAQLIEESDDGFYIVGVAEPKAVFVPRSAVALIYFADKPTDSTILRQHLKGNKP